MRRSGPSSVVLEASALEHVRHVVTEELQGAMKALQRDMLQQFGRNLSEQDRVHHELSTEHQQQVLGHLDRLNKQMNRGIADVRDDIDQKINPMTERHKQSVKTSVLLSATGLYSDSLATGILDEGEDALEHQVFGSIHLVHYNSEVSGLLLESMRKAFEMHHPVHSETSDIIAEVLHMSAHVKFNNEMTQQFATRLLEIGATMRNIVLRGQGDRRLEEPLAGYHQMIQQSKALVARFSARGWFELFLDRNDGMRDFETLDRLMTATAMEMQQLLDADYMHTKPRNYIKYAVEFEEMMKHVEALGGVNGLTANRRRLQQAASLMGTAFEALRKELVAYHEGQLEASLSEQESHTELMNVLHNRSCVLFWASSFKDAESVQWTDFVPGLREHLTRRLFLGEDEVDELLNEETLIHLRVKLDRNMDGDLTVVELRNALGHADDLVDALTELGKDAEATVQSLKAPEPFIGREDLLLRAANAVPRHKRVMIHGAEGSGKTDFLLAIATHDRVEEAFRGGIFYISLRTSRTPNEAIAELAAGLQIFAEEDLEGSVRSFLAGRPGRVLLLVDDVPTGRPQVSRTILELQQHLEADFAEYAASSSASDTRRPHQSEPLFLLFAAGTNCNTALGVAPELTFAIPALSDAAAVDLVEHLQQNEDTPFSKIDPNKHGMEIAQLCRNIPLNLTMLSRLPIAELYDMLIQHAVKNMYDVQEDEETGALATRFQLLQSLYTLLPRRMKAIVMALCRISGSFEEDLALRMAAECLDLMNTPISAEANAELLAAGLGEGAANGGTGGMGVGAPRPERSRRKERTKSILAGVRGTQLWQAETATPEEARKQHLRVKAARILRGLIREGLVHESRTVPGRFEVLHCLRVFILERIVWTPTPDETLNIEQINEVEIATVAQCAFFTSYVEYLQRIVALLRAEKRTTALWLFDLERPSFASIFAPPPKSSIAASGPESKENDDAEPTTKFVGGSGLTAAAVAAASASAANDGADAGEKKAAELLEEGREQWQTNIPGETVDKCVELFLEVSPVLEFRFSVDEIRVMHERLQEFADAAEDYFSRAKLLASLTRIYFHLERFEDAIKTGRLAVAQFSEHVGENYVEIADVAELIAHAYMKQNQASDALAHYRIAERVYKKTASSAGEDDSAAHLNVAHMQRHAAKILLSTQKREEAMDKLMQALLVYQKFLGTHEHTATVLYYVSRIRLEFGELVEASESIHQCIEMREKVFPKASVEVAEALYLLAQIVKAEFKAGVAQQRDLTEVIPLLEHARDVQRERLGEANREYEDTVLLLAQSFEHTENIPRATTEYENVLRIRRALYTTDHDRVRQLLYDLGCFYLRNGETELAVERLAECQRVFEKLYGEDDVGLTDILRAKADALTRVNRLHEAYVAIQQCMSMRSFHFGEVSEPYAEALYILAAVQFKQQQPDDSMATYKRCIDIREQVLGPNDLTVADTVYRLACVLQKQLKLEEAMEYYDKARQIREANAVASGAGAGGDDAPAQGTGTGDTVPNARRLSSSSASGGLGGP